jgi:hypothetical protein
MGGSCFAIGSDRSPFIIHLQWMDGIPGEVIPHQIKKLCSHCFAHCQCLESISFEIPSSLTRIESSAFTHSSLRSLLIPRAVEFLDPSCFNTLSCPSISVESGNDHYLIDGFSLYDRGGTRLIRSFDCISVPVISSTIEILCSKCFAFCRSLRSISFESPSSLTRIESFAFAFSSLRSIIIPTRVKILCSECFCYCLSVE